MLGQSSCAAIQIYKEQPKAHYTHCHCHSLDLSIKDVTRSSKMLSDVMDTAGEISVLIKFSPKREKVLENRTTEIKSRVIGCQSQMGKFDLFFGLHLEHRLYSHI